MTTNRHPMITLGRIACGTLAALAFAGCHGSASSSDASAAAADQAKPDYTVIQRGRPPISTLVTVTGQVQVVDLDADKVVLKKTRIAPNTLITLNPNGLTLNTTPAADGPFNRQHKFEFRLFK